MDTIIVTAIYSNLHGSDLGGRPSRLGHYKYSLKTLLQMSESNFICYTSDEEIDELKNFYFNEHNIDENRLTIKTFNLRDFKYTEKINRLKKIDEVVKSDRCFEIQYLKFIWCYNECLNNQYKNVFWFDAGLSHCGLIPSRYFNDISYWDKYYSSSIFTDRFLTNLIKFSEDKITICAKENINNFWSHTVPEHYYNNFCMDRHIIGGFFGGKIESMKTFCNLFFDYLEKLLTNEDKLYFEEHIMSLIYYNHPELFNSKYFDIWWHEEDKVPGIDLYEYTKTRKSFYKILEEFNV